MSEEIDKKKTEHTVELASLIATGSIPEVERFLAEKFHLIRHTQSFSILVERLKKSEAENKKLREALEQIRTRHLDMTDDGQYPCSICGVDIARLTPVERGNHAHKCPMELAEKALCDLPTLDNQGGD